MIDLPPRAGAKPKTTSTNPHQQQSQNPTPEVYELLLRKAFEFPHVERRPSAISVPGAQALWLSEEVASARPEAFLIGREFAHVHPSYDGSMHMMLPARGDRAGAGKGLGGAAPDGAPRPGPADHGDGASAARGRGRDCFPGDRGLVPLRLRRRSDRVNPRGSCCTRLSTPSKSSTANQASSSAAMFLPSRPEVWRAIGA